jgi:thiol-disulfide isomerase/thioredoxin
MKQKVSLLVAVAMSVSGTAACGQGSVDIGDPAPPLSIVEWVKGRPVDLRKDARNKIHVVEFWATWCPPCKMTVPLLTEYQRKYEKDVVIVGVTEPDARGNTPSAIRKFVNDMGEKMDYVVAIDDGRTTKSYMASAGVVGIPYAFVVNREGNVVWHGSPLDKALDDVLARLIAGTYSLETAKIEREVTKKLEDLDFPLQLGQWGVVWDGLIDILKLDPANNTAMEALITVSTQELKNTDALRTWVRSHISDHRDNARAMHTLAESLCGICELKSRFPDLALEAAKAAYHAGKKPDARRITVYARALYQIGELDRAIALQQDAVAVALAGEREETKSYLDYYRACKKLQAASR